MKTVKKIVILLTCTYLAISAVTLAPRKVNSSRLNISTMSDDVTAPKPVQSIIK